MRLSRASGQDAFLVIGLAFIALGAVGQTAFLYLGIPLALIGVVTKVRRKQIGQ